jgi:hypothetical protein
LLSLQFCPAISSVSSALSYSFFLFIPCCCCRVVVISAAVLCCRNPCCLQGKLPGEVVRVVKTMVEQKHAHWLAEAALVGLVLVVAAAWLSALVLLPVCWVGLGGASGCGVSVTGSAAAAAATATAGGGGALFFVHE